MNNVAYMQNKISKLSNEDLHKVHDFYTEQVRLALEMLKDNLFIKIATDNVNDGNQMLGIIRTELGKRKEIDLDIIIDKLIRLEEVEQEIKQTELKIDLTEIANYSNSLLK